jgi:hypothetical protein
MPGEARVQRRGQRVLVGGRPDFLPHPLLGRRIGRREPGRVAGHRERPVDLRPRQAEVGQVGVVRVRPGDEQDVLRLDVAVHDAAAVRPVQGPGHLADDPQRPAGVELLVLGDEVAQIQVAQRCGQVEQPVLLAVVPDRQDVRVGHALGGLRLTLEALAELLVLGQPAREHLDRRGAAVLEVERLVDAAHPALGQLGLELEAPAHHVAHRDAAAVAAQRHTHHSPSRPRRPLTFAPRITGASPQRAPSRSGRTTCIFLHRADGETSLSRAQARWKGVRLPLTPPPLSRSLTVIVPCEDSCARRIHP